MSAQERNPQVPAPTAYKVFCPGIDGPDLYTDFSRSRSGGLGIPNSLRIFQFIVIHTVKGFGIINKAEVDVFLEFSCFFDDPVDTGNLISGYSAYSKTSLNIWKFSVHILFEASLGEFSALLC